MYISTNSNTVLRDDGASIPMDPSNPDYQEYLRWVSDGGVTAPYTPPAITSVSPRQARLALLQQGLLTKVQQAVTAAGGSTEITWDYATVFDRQDPLIDNIGQALGLTSDQIDQLFALASTL